MDLISRKAAIDKLNAIPSGNWSKTRYKRELWNVPSVPAVPLDKLCEWLERNAAGRWNGLEYTAAGWKDELTTWMEEQDADRQ